MDVTLHPKTEQLVARRASELGLTPQAYLQRLVELDAGADEVLETALLAAEGETDDPIWDWDGMLARGLERARRDP